MYLTLNSPRPLYSSVLYTIPLGHFGLPCGSTAGKESACQCMRPRFNSWVRKMPWRRKWQSTPALLPGKSCGRRSLIGYSPWGRKESDLAERLHFHKSENFQGYGYLKQVGHVMPSFVHPLVYNGSCAPMNKTSFISFPAAKTSTPS